MGKALSRLERLEVREEEGVLGKILELQNLMSNYWVGQKVHLSFSVPCYGKT